LNKNYDVISIERAANSKSTYSDDELKDGFLNPKSLGMDAISPRVPPPV
jgi:hypothetical protein